MRYLQIVFRTVNFYSIAYSILQIDCYTLTHALFTMAFPSFQMYNYVLNISFFIINVYPNSAIIRACYLMISMI